MPSSLYTVQFLRTSSSQKTKVLIKGQLLQFRNIRTSDADIFPDAPPTFVEMRTQARRYSSVKLSLSAQSTDRATESGLLLRNQPRRRRAGNMLGLSKFRVIGHTPMLIVN